MMIANDTRPQTRREALHARRRTRPTRITVPARVSPHVRLVFEEMGRQRRTYDEVEEGSGVLRATIKAWRHKNKPGVESLTAVFGFLGWDFVPIPRANVLPRALVVDLETVAAKHQLDTSSTIQALVAHVTGIHVRSEKVDAPTTAASLDDMAPRGFGGTDSVTA